MTTNYITSVGVQQFSITIASGQTTGTATITAVGSGAFILFGGVNPTVSANAEEDFATVTLTDSTTITATRRLGTAGTVTVTGSVVDGDTTNLVKSVQYGTVTIANASTSGTTSVSAVTNANTAIAYLGQQAGETSSGVNLDFCTVSLSGTTVTAARGSAGSTLSVIVGFCVIEFQSSCLTANGVQQVSATSSASVTSFTGSFTAVTLANALTIYGGSNIASVGTGLDKGLMYGSLTATTTLTVNLTTAAANAKTYNASIVEFKSGVLNSAVQRATKTLTGAATGTSTITGITLGNSGLSFLGNSTNVTTALSDEASGQVVLTNGTTVTSCKVTATGNITNSFEAFEFPAYSGGGGGGATVDPLWFGMTA